VEGDCRRAAGRCPNRRNTRPVTGSVKSKAGRRTVGLPAPLVALLRKHRSEQNAERTAARQLWRDEGWVFTTPTGGPLNHYTDNRDWKRLLREAGLREARLHDARHTAATVLLILGQPERTVMSLMGWSTTGMAKRYQHVTDTVRADVASQVGSLIWEARAEGAADETVTVRRDSLAAILKVVEDGLLTHDDTDDVDLTELQAALTDLHTAMARHGNDPNGDTK
jgi:integrase